jgi:integrase/recombinase XerD
LFQKYAQGAQLKNIIEVEGMTAEIENQIKDFRSYLIQIGYKPRTVYMVYGCVKDFLAYHKATAANPFTTEHIHQFYEWLQIRPNKNKAGGLSEQYISHHLYALRVFFNWLEAIGEISFNPMSVMKFKRPEGNPREPLSQDQISTLFKATESLKEKTMLHLFYSCGLRRSEAETLNIQDIHFKKQILYVRAGKGAKRRAVPMTEKVSSELESYYLQERTLLIRVKDTEAFILNRVGQRMRGYGYNKVLKTMLERAELSNTITLHHLRHSIATHLLELGLEIEKVRDFLGHGFLETTQIYAKVHPSQLRKL